MQNLATVLNWLYIPAFIAGVVLYSRGTNPDSIPKLTAARNCVVLAVLFMMATIVLRIGIDAELWMIILNIFTLLMAVAQLFMYQEKLDTAWQIAKDNAARELFRVTEALNLPLDLFDKRYANGVESVPDDKI